MDEDEMLMAEIDAAADKAEAAKPAMTDIGALAQVLAAHFEHRSEYDIKQKITALWQARGLFYIG